MYTTSLYREIAVLHFFSHGRFGFISIVPFISAPKIVTIGKKG